MISYRPVLATDTDQFWLPTYLHLSDPHATANPPPEPQPTLPQHERPQQILQPAQIILSHFHKVNGSRRDSERHRSGPECTCASVGAPCAFPIDEEAPDEERHAEDQEQGRIKYIADCVAEIDSGSVAREGCIDKAGSGDCERSCDGRQGMSGEVYNWLQRGRTEKEKDKLDFGLGRKQ